MDGEDILLAMAVTASLGPGLENAAIAMIIVWWPIYARLMRGQVLSVKSREHVEAAVAAGASHSRTLASATAGVSSEGLNSTQLPASSAGTIWPLGKWPGKL